jgi:uncharacterized protein YqhQ
VTVCFRRFLEAFSRTDKEEWRCCSASCGEWICVCMQPQRMCSSLPALAFCFVWILIVVLLSARRQKKCCVQKGFCLALIEMLLVVLYFWCIPLAFRKQKVFQNLEGMH